MLYSMGSQTVGHYSATELNRGDGKNFKLTLNVNDIGMCIYFILLKYS